MADVLHTNNFDRGYKKSDKNMEIEYYEERLSKRREKEKDEKKLNDFLHNSLRASERLKSLEKAKRMNYKINDAYLDEGLDEDEVIDVAGLTDALCNRKGTKISLSRSDIDWLQKLVRRDIFKSSIETCAALSNILRRYSCPPLTGSSEARQRLDAVSKHISGNLQRSKESHYKFQMQELLQILSSPEMQTMCDANDYCASLVARNSQSRKEVNRMEPKVAGVSVDGAPAVLVVAAASGGGQRTAEKSRSPPENVRIIKCNLKGCYAQIYPSDKGVSLKMVVLEKGNAPLGATVRNERDAVVVGRIVVGGVAHLSGLLKEGDELLSVNGMELTGRDVNEVSDIFGRLTGTLKFMVAPCDESSTLSTAQPPQTTMIHLRALYTYNPEDDLYIPCKDIGLGFERGDILHVNNVMDPNWWQAYKDVEGAESGSMGELAGLIPSPDYQYKREVLKKRLAGNKGSMDQYSSMRQDSSILCLKKNKRSQPATVNGGWLYNVDINGRPSNSEATIAGRKRKHNKKSDRSTYCPGEMELDQPDPDINTYEEVQMFLPQPHRKRPIVLIGPIGQHELAKKIVNTDRDQFSLIRQHTTLETSSSEYRHVTKDEFKHLQNQEEFIETALFEKNWYGISKTEVKTVIDSGKTAVLVLQPESLQAVRKTSFLPYVIFVSPPTKVDNLRTLQFSINRERPSDEDLFHMIDRAKKVDFKFGHMFDNIVVIESLDKARDSAVVMISRLERDTQWVPSRWLCQRPVSHLP